MTAQANAKINLPRGSVADLVVRAAAGEGGAFAALYNEYQPQVYRYLTRLTRDRVLAEDLTSETFLSAFRNMVGFVERPHSGGFAAWLTVIARSRAMDHFKAGRTRLEVSIGDLYDADEQTSSAEAGALRGLDAVDARQTLAVAMAALSPLQYECVQLRYLDGLSVDETAAQIGTRPGAVKGLSYRAMHTMRRVLADQAVAA